MNEDIKGLLERAQPSQIRPLDLDQVRLRAARRTTRRRGVVVGLAAVAVAAVGGAGLILLDREGKDDTVSTVASETSGRDGRSPDVDGSEATVRSPSSAVPCQVPPSGAGVAECPVSPTGVGTSGEVGYLPPGWILTGTVDEPVPTGSSLRIQSLQRRYAEPDGGFLVVTVTYGDVAPPTPAVFGGTLDASLRVGETVLVVPSGHRPDSRFLWSPQPRVVVDADFVEPSGLTPETMRRVIASISTDSD